MIEIQKHVGNVSGIGQMCAALSLHCGRLVQHPDTQMVAWRARLGCNGFFSYRWVNERAGGRAKILHARMLACVHDCWGRVHGNHCICVYICICMNTGDILGSAQPI